MSDAADDAKDPVVSTPGDVERDGETAKQGQLTGGAPAGVRKPRGRPRGSRTKPPDAKLAGDAKAAATAEEAKELRKLKKHLAGLLQGPSLVLEPWPASHVEAQGPNLAAAIVTAAEGDPALRRRLLKFFQGGTMAQLVGAAVIYIAPVAIYYGAPAPAPIRGMLSVPDRGQQLAMEAGQRPSDPAAQQQVDQQREEQAWREAAVAAGYGEDGVAQYMHDRQAAAQTAIASVRGPHYAPPARPEPPAPGA